MKIEIPILIKPARDGKQRLFSVRPVFFQGPSATDKDLWIAKLKLTSKIHDHLTKMVGNERFRDLSDWTFAPETKLTNQELRFDVARQHLHIYLPLVTFTSLERRIAMCPLLDDCYFEVINKNDLAARSYEVSRAYFRKIQKEEGDKAALELAERFKKKSTFRLDLIDVNLNTQRRSTGKGKNHQDDWRSELERDGYRELEEVGRCLNRLFPSQLEEAFCRDELVDHLYRMMTSRRPRSVLLLGPDMVGKTTILHSLVRRMIERIERPKKAHPHWKTTWHLTPGRIISGMSHSGEWEHRLSAILEHACRREVTLYFDQPLGLLEAGKTSQGNLAFGNVLHQYLQNGGLRVIAEATEEQLRLFRQRNRGLADQFEVVHIPQPSEEETLRILIQTVQELEWRCECRFDPSVLSTVLELTNHFESERAMPGKAVHWLSALAVRHRGSEEPITRNQMIDAFRERSGLKLAIFNTGKSNSVKTIDRKEIEQQLSQRIVGQHHAVSQMAEVATLAESMLCDPKRPLASLFFLGPTGVGKTECAKELARYFFGSKERLLRFDANELSSPQAVANLVGGYHGGEGTLTGAVRRQPFCVLLFDEIEKGHPDLYDILLQVLGEARLTDSQGQLASFSQAIIIFTSNLGTRQATKLLGFNSESSPATASSLSGQASRTRSVYLKAVQDFFRPEWVNRIDRIVPFDVLNEQELKQITQLMLDEVVARQGLSRRCTMLDISADAQTWLARRGHDPQYGARATRRTIEQDLVAPVSRFLASTKHTTPTVLEVDLRDGQLQIAGHELIEAPRPTRDTWDDAARLASLNRQQIVSILESSLAAVDRMQETIVSLKPDGPIRYSRESGVYFFLAEKLLDLRTTLTSYLADTSTIPLPMLKHKTRRSRAQAIESLGGSTSGIFKELMSADDINATLDEFFQQNLASTTKGDFLQAQLRQLADLYQCVTGEPWLENSWKEQKAILFFLPDGRNQIGRVEAWGEEEIHLGFAGVQRSIAADGVVDNDGAGILVGNEFQGFWANEYVRQQERTTLAFAEDGTMTAFAAIAITAYDPKLLPVEVIESYQQNQPLRWPRVTQIRRHKKDQPPQTIQLANRYLDLPLPPEVEQALAEITE